MPIKYSDVYSYKNQNSLTDKFLVDCWPKVALGGTQYNLSTHVAALACRVDATHDDIPYESPSNKELRIDSAVLSDTTLVDLSKAKANVLNGYGVVTALNFVGWRAWGNRVACYPANADVKDNFIPMRRMMNWVGNQLVLNFFSRIDSPVSKRLVNTVLDSANCWLNGLAARGTILSGSRVLFLEEDNPTTSLIDGKVTFKVYLGLQSPARVIEFNLEYDTNLYQSLFS